MATYEVHTLVLVCSAPMYLLLLFFILIQYCDEYIAANYSGMTQRAEGRDERNRVTIVSDIITLVPGEGIKCSMNKSNVSIDQ